LAILLIIIATLLMLPGVIAIAFMLPGVPYIFIISLVYAFADHFTHINTTDVFILAGMAILSVIIDQTAGLIAARYGGARGKTFLYGLIGALIGTIIFPLFGGFIGLFIGIAVGELIRRRTHVQALKAATVGLIGSVTGIAINICLGVVFIALFLVFTLSNTL
jgi:uncharacterized protein YqgC (DUF456 family)